MTDTGLAEPLVWIARMVLGVTFLVSGAAKLRNVDDFVHGAVEYRFLPPRVVRPIARLLPAGEVVLGVMLLAGLLGQVTAGISALLLLSFIAGVSVNLWRRRSIPCHCFGTSPHEQIGAVTLLRLGVLGIAALVVTTHTPSQLGLFPPHTDVAGAISSLSLAVSVSLAVVLMGPAAVLANRVREVRRSKARREDRGADLGRGDGVDGPIRNGATRV